MRRKRPRLHLWTWARRGTALLFLVLLLVASKVMINNDTANAFQGSAAATTTLDLLPLVDPLALLESTIAARDVALTALLGSGILLLTAVLLGPIFCGWVCPLGLVFDLQHSLRRRVLRLFGKKRPERPVGPLPENLRYAVLGGMLGFALLAGWPLFQVLSPISILVRVLVFGLWLDIVVVLAVLLVDLAWPRLWCRALCPLGALYSLVGRFGLLRIRVNLHLSGKYPCQQCSRHCPMGIAVMEDYAEAGEPWVDHPSCIRCGSCADVCPRDVIRMGLWRKSAWKATAQRENGDVALPILDHAAATCEACETSEG
jgi:ferredoxin-type protein NapH